MSWFGRLIGFGSTSFSNNTRKVCVLNGGIQNNDFNDNNDKHVNNDDDDDDFDNNNMDVSDDDDDDEYTEGPFREQQLRLQVKPSSRKHGRDNNDNTLLNNAIDNGTKLKRQKAMKILQSSNVLLTQRDPRYSNVTKIAAKAQIPEKEVREIRTQLKNNGNKTFNPGPSVAQKSNGEYVEWSQENHNEAVKILINDRFLKQRDEGYLNADKIASMCQIKVKAVEAKTSAEKLKTKSAIDRNNELIKVARNSITDRFKKLKEKVVEKSKAIINRLLLTSKGNTNEIPNADEEDEEDEDEDEEDEEE